MEQFALCFGIMMLRMVLKLWLFGKFGGTKSCLKILFYINNLMRLHIFLLRCPEELYPLFEMLIYFHKCLFIFMIDCRSWFFDFSGVHISGWNICFFMGWFNHLLGGRVVYKENAICKAYIFSIKAS